MYKLVCLFLPSDDSQLGIEICVEDENKWFGV